MSYRDLKRSICQRLIDRTICFVLALWYRIIDPIRLYYARKSWNPSSNPLISILIPTRDRWSLLWDKAVASLIKQTYKNWELIVVDDGSGHSEFLSGIALRVFRLEKDFHYPKVAWARWCAGPVRALNLALTKVRGDYILRMDDDDELASNALEVLLQHISFLNKETDKETDVEYISAAHYADGKLVYPYEIHQNGRQCKIGGIQTTLMRSYLRCFKYNPDCWRKIRNPMNELDLVNRMLRAKVKTAYVDVVVCRINPRPGMTTIGWKAQCKEYQEEGKI